MNTQARNPITGRYMHTGPTYSLAEQVTICFTSVVAILSGAAILFLAFM